jgi:hypothetical protein
MWEAIKRALGIHPKLRSMALRTEEYKPRDIRVDDVPNKGGPEPEREAAAKLLAEQNQQRRLRRQC